MNIVVLDGYTLNPGDLSWEKFEALGSLKVFPRTNPQDVKERIKEAPLVFTNKTPISEEDMEGSKVKFIGILATGYNIVDVEAAKRRGIVVSNVPTYGTRTVAQFATAMMLELCHHVGMHSDSVHRGDWVRSQDWCYLLAPQVELVGKTLGLFGLGRIGLAFAQIGEALGMDVIYHSRSKKEVPYAYVSLEELLSKSDVLSLHSPLNAQTQGMIHRDTLSRMKPTAFLLNCSRGPLIVEKDLAWALEEGVISGAALDVVGTEPMDASSVLLGVKNLLITPHIAWSTREARERIMAISLDNLQAFLAGEPLHEV